MNIIQDPAGAACLITLIAAVCSFLSLMIAVDSSRYKFADSDNPRVFKFVFVALCIVSIITACLCLHYIGLPWIPFTSFLSGEDRWVVFGLAVLMLPLLGAAIWMTGGPTHSWFTPFLLVLIPLLILLNERDNSLLLGLFVAMVAVYVITAFVLPRSTFELCKKDGKLDPRCRQRYEICCCAFVFLAVIFPTGLQLYDPKSGQGSGQATAAEVVDGSKEGLNSE